MISPKAAAAHLGISVDRVRKLIASGALHAVNIGLDRPLWAIEETELARFAALDRPSHRPRKEPEMSYRCTHCGAYTGATIAEAQESAAKEHGVGICTSPCHWCNEGVKHAPHTCANVTDGMSISDMPSAVRDFLDWHQL